MEIDFAAKACTPARTSTRKTKRVLNSFKILNEIWTNSNDVPEEKAKCACVILLAICVSNGIRARVGMKRAFWKLEHDDKLPKRPSISSDATFMSFLEKEKGFLCPEEISQPIQKLMKEYLSFPWKD